MLEKVSYIKTDEEQSRHTPATVYFGLSWFPDRLISFFSTHYHLTIIITSSVGLTTVLIHN